MAEAIEGKATTGTFVREDQPSTKFHTASKTYSYLRQGSGNDAWVYVYTNLPTDLAGRDVTAAWLEVEMVEGAGSRTITVQRHAKPTTTYANMTWNTRALALAGSTAVPVTQDSADTSWIFPVTADLQAISLGGAYYGWRFHTSYTAQWRMHGWDSVLAVTLHVELDGVPEPPEELRPDGVTALAAPTFVWQEPDELVSARMQVAAVDAAWTEDAGFTSPLWDSGVVVTTVPQLDSDDLGWTGMAEDAVVEVTAMQTTSGGPSKWGAPVTVTRKSLPTLTITGPIGTTEDPTPTISWTASDQESYQVWLTSGGTQLYDSTQLPGDASAHTVTKGATTEGQTLKAKVRIKDDEPRSPSPGDPGYVEKSVTFTYVPGAGAAIDSLAAVQVGVTPWVELSWTDGEVADEYGVMRDGVLVAQFAGLDDESDPVNSYRDWTCPPNTDVVYNVVRIVEGSAGAAGPTEPLRTVVKGEWVGDPASGVSFTTKGEQSALAFTESSVTYEIPGAEFDVTRTFALKGRTGPGGGSMEDYDGRSMAEQSVDVWAVKSDPTVTYRYVIGDINIPALIRAVDPEIDKDRFLALPAAFPRRIVKQVSFTVTQNGELPFSSVPA